MTDVPLLPPAASPHLDPVTLLDLTLGTLSPEAEEAALDEAQDAWLGRELEQLLAERLDDASELAISVAQGRVTLRGRVSCSLVSLLAEDLVLAFPEVRDCTNELVVRTTRDDDSLAA